MRNASVRPPLSAVLGVVVMALATGCGRASDVRPGDVRTYVVARPPAAPAGAAEAAEPGAAIRYAVPDGWTDRGGAGMRLATLVIGDPAAGHEVTVIPAAGTLRGNVERWQGQLDVAVTETDRAAAVERALATAETVDVAGASATIVTLFDAAAAVAPDAAGQAILAAIIPVDGVQSLFVKFKGDAGVARREREAFVRFVASLRWR